MATNVKLSLGDGLYNSDIKVLLYEVSVATAIQMDVCWQ